MKGRASVEVDTPSIYLRQELSGARDVNVLRARGKGT